MSDANPPGQGPKEDTARPTNNAKTSNGRTSAADAPDHPPAGRLKGQTHERGPPASPAPAVFWPPAPPQGPPAAAVPSDAQRVAFVAPRNPAEFLGMPFQGAMGVGGGAVNGITPFHALGRLAPSGSLQAPEADSDGQTWPPAASVPLRAGSGATGLTGPVVSAGGEIELPAPHDPDQMAAFWQLMGIASNGNAPQGSMMALQAGPPQLPLLAPVFPPELALAMDIDAADGLDMAIKEEEDEEEAAKAAEKVAARRRQLREAQARAREKKRKEDEEKMEWIKTQTEATRAEIEAAKAELKALLAVQREYCRHLAMRSAILKGLDPEWQVKQRKSVNVVPWAALAATAPPPPQPDVLMPRASTFDEVINYARQYVLTVRLAVEDAIEYGLDPETMAAVEAAVQGGPDPRAAFMQLVRTRESFRKALKALKYERPQPCADEERWSAAAAAVVGRCPPDALLRLRRACSRAKERRNCVQSALVRVSGDLDRLLPAETTDSDSDVPCCRAAAAEAHLDAAAIAATVTQCCSEINMVFHDIADFFLTELGVVISALVIASCEPDWPNWPAVAAQVVALAEQRGVIPPPPQAN